MMKKVLSLLLSVVMLFSITAGIDLSAYATTKTGKCGDNVFYSFNTKTGKLTLSGSGKMKNYTYDGLNGSKAPWYSYSSSIKTVTIGNKITSIGSASFFECDNMKSVSIPNSITSIGTDAFYWCVSLKISSLPNSVTSIGEHAFFDVTFTKLNIPEKMTNISHGAFSGCKVSEITIPKTVSSISTHAFSFISNLKTVVIENGTKKINSWAFSDCNNLQTITIPKSVTSIGRNPFGEEGTFDNLRIIGYPNSYANNYAEKHNIPFSEYTKISLSSSSFVYDGKAKKPTVTVKDSNSKKIPTSNYTVTYQSGRKKVGTYTVKITLKGKYENTVTKTFTIKPKATSISSISAKSKGFTVKWKKLTTQTTGYQIQYSTSSKFTNAKTVTVSKNTTTSKTISNLKSKKKYYVRVRTYKTVDGKKIYSAWSKAKTVTTKK